MYIDNQPNEKKEVEPSDEEYFRGTYLKNSDLPDRGDFRCTSTKDIEKSKARMMRVFWIGILGLSPFTVLIMGHSTHAVTTLHMYTGSYTFFGLLVSLLLQRVQRSRLPKQLIALNYKFLDMLSLTGMLVVGNGLGATILSLLLNIIFHTWR